ncbi:MAG: asparagine synthase (glutamine-hydrolyzing) [Alphaproteobacteria bacterium]|nr:asparagine synthase (glutamine-hydrolyzing) [Alphaproteobacteria bacterium]
MCGITGVFNYKNTSPVDRDVLLAMRDVMVHRGPDGGGEWMSQDGRIAFGHRRLSIIDLSETANQPMHDGTGLTVTFNGEIYNHALLRQELRQAGMQFKTDHSDTEVLLHGFRHWGFQGLLQRIEGDFAFAIWDDKKRKLSLARDRIGVKPLCFSAVDGAFVFASEIKSLLEHPAVGRAIDPMALYHYLSFLTSPAPQTMFKGIWKLPAGHWLEVEEGKLTSGRYWDAVPGKGIDPSETRNLSDKALEEFYVTGIRSRLEDAVAKRMMSDVPVGVFLSGGVDSSTNVALMSKHSNGPVRTFTIGFSDHKHLNELDHAQRIADRYKTEHHEILINEADMIGYLETLVHHQDEPIADWVCIPLHFVSKLAKDSGVTVIQVGEGADEQFSGYASYMGYLDLYKRYWQPFRTMLPGFAQHGIAGLAGMAASMRPSLRVYADIIDRAARNREHFWSGATVFWESMKHKVVNVDAFHPSPIDADMRATGLLPPSYEETDTFNVIKSFLGPFDAAHPGRDPLTRMIYNEFRLRLPELLLMRVDKITMASSLEARVPFLDHNLVEFSMDIPQDWKIKGNEPKYLLKKAVEDLLPHDLIYRKKQGFGAPMSEWLRGDFGKSARDVILGSRLMDQGHFKRAEIERMIETHQSNREDNSLYIWTLFNVASWYDYWIDR